MNRGMLRACGVLLVLALFCAPAAAQETDGDAAATPDATSQVLGESPAATVLIQIPSDGLGYSEDGELIMVTSLTNTGTEISPPLNLIAIVLNDCIIAELPQTCRFAAFGNFESVTPNGIAPGNTVQWVFNFGPQIQVDLGRWSVIWYQLPSAP